MWEVGGKPPHRALHEPDLRRCRPWSRMRRRLVRSVRDAVLWATDRYALKVSDWNTSYTRNIWRPEEPRLFVRRTDGIGWSINFAHLFRRTHRA